MFVEVAKYNPKNNLELSLDLHRFIYQNKEVDESFLIFLSFFDIEIFF